ncbi:uncharacterized protein LOC111088274 isoform X2 [Limulus polyphemus]|uniref:Uncharacterized protein LOC111088274 isoform X2 n=1 Tax=Limulus polyphemus TaxID=6850 RepID=A0ABM1TCK8_LIMPO|nr:uncharacterized protein LOC111088274 isoform X2 [Limulus polyphemus]
MPSSSNLPETKVCFVVLPKLPTLMSEKNTITTSQRSEHRDNDERFTDCELSDFKGDYFEIGQTEMECPMKTLDLDFSTLKNVTEVSKIHSALDPGYGDFRSYFHHTQWSPDIKENKAASKKHMIDKSIKSFPNQRRQNELQQKCRKLNQMRSQQSEAYSNNPEKGFVVISKGGTTKLLIKSKKCENKPVQSKTICRRKSDNSNSVDPKEGSAVEGESLVFVSSPEDNKQSKISSPEKDGNTKKLFGSDSKEPIFSFLQSNTPTHTGFLNASYKYNVPKEARQNTDLIAMSKEACDQDGHYQLQNAKVLPQNRKKISPLSVYTTIFDNVISSVTCKRFKRKSSKRKVDKDCSLLFKKFRTDVEGRNTTNETKKCHLTSQSAKSNEEEVVKDMMSDIIYRVVLLTEEDINFSNPSSREMYLFTEFCNNYGFDETEFLNVHQILNPQILSPEGDDAVSVSTETLFQKKKLVKTRKFGKYRRKRLTKRGITGSQIKKQHSRKYKSYKNDNVPNIVTSDFIKNNADSSKLRCLNTTETVFQDYSGSSTLPVHVNNTNLKSECRGSLKSSERQEPEGCRFSLEKQLHRNVTFSHTDTSKEPSTTSESSDKRNPNEANFQRGFTATSDNCYTTVIPNLRNAETSCQNDPNCAPPNTLEMIASRGISFRLNNRQSEMKLYRDILPRDKTAINTGCIEEEVRAGHAVDVSLNRVGTVEVNFKNNTEINTAKHPTVGSESSHDASIPEGIFGNKNVQQLSLESQVYEEKQKTSLENSKSEKIASYRHAASHATKYEGLKEKKLDSHVTVKKRARRNNLTDSEPSSNETKDQPEDNIPLGQHLFNTESPRNVRLRSMDDQEIVLSDSNSEDGTPYMTRTTNNSSFSPGSPSASKSMPELEEISSLRKYSKYIFTKSGREIAKVTHTGVSHPEESCEEIPHVRIKSPIDLTKSVTSKGSREETVLKTNSDIHRKNSQFGCEERTTQSRHSAGKTWTTNNKESRDLVVHDSKNSKWSPHPKDILRESVLLKLLNNRKLVAPPSEQNIVNNNSASTKPNVFKKNATSVHVSRPNKTKTLPVNEFEKYSSSDNYHCLENDSFGLLDRRTIFEEENFSKEKHFENILEKQQIEFTPIEDKVERLKREIFYLDLMADQKEKEKALIQQFKKQKEEKLKRMYHKQALIAHLTKKKMQKYKKGETLPAALEKQEKGESVKKPSCTEDTPVHPVSGSIELIDQPKSVSCRQMNQSLDRNLVQNDSLSNDSKTLSQRDQAGNIQQQNQMLTDKGSVVDLPNTSFTYATSGAIIVPGNQVPKTQFFNPPHRVEIINSSTNAVPLGHNGERIQSLGQTTYAFFNKMAEGYNSSSRQTLVQRRFRKIRPKVLPTAETTSSQKTTSDETSTPSILGSQSVVLQRNSTSIPQTVSFSESITKSGSQRVPHFQESPSDVPYQVQLPQGNFSNVTPSLSESICTGDPQKVPLLQRNSISIPQTVSFSESITKSGSQRVPHIQESPSNVPYQVQLPQGNFSNVTQSLSESICTGDPQKVPLLQRNSISIPQVLFPQGNFTNTSYQVPLLQRDFTCATKGLPSSDINAISVQQQIPLSQGNYIGVLQRLPSSENNDTNVQHQITLSRGISTDAPQRLPSSEINDTSVQQKVPLSRETCTGVPQKHPSSEINDTSVQQQITLSQGICTDAPKKITSSETSTIGVQQKVPLSQGTCTGVPQRHPSSEINDTSVQQEITLSQGISIDAPQRLPSSEINDTSVQQKVPLSQETCTGVPQKHSSSEVNDINIQQQVSLSQGICTDAPKKIISSETSTIGVQQQVPLSQGTCTGVPQRHPSSEINDINVKQQVPLSQGICTSDLQQAPLVKEKPTISSHQDLLVQGSFSNSSNQPIGEQNNNITTSSEFLNMPIELQCWKLLVACVQAMTNQNSFLSHVMASQNPLLTQNLANIYPNLIQIIPNQNTFLRETLFEKSSTLAQDGTSFPQKTNEFQNWAQHYKTCRKS